MLQHLVSKQKKKMQVRLQSLHPRGLPKKVIYPITRLEVFLKLSGTNLEILTTFLPPAPPDRPPLWPPPLCPPRWRPPPRPSPGLSVPPESSGPPGSSGPPDPSPSKKNILPTTTTTNIYFSPPPSEFAGFSLPVRRNWRREEEVHALKDEKGG